MAEFRTVLKLDFRWIRTNKATAPAQWTVSFHLGKPSAKVRTLAAATAAQQLRRCQRRKCIPADGNGITTLSQATAIQTSCTVGGHQLHGPPIRALPFRCRPTKAINGVDTGAAARDNQHHPNSYGDLSSVDCCDAKRVRKDTLVNRSGLGSRCAEAYASW